MQDVQLTGILELLRHWLAVPWFTLVDTPITAGRLTGLVIIILAVWWLSSLLERAIRHVALRGDRREQLRVVSSRRQFGNPFSGQQYLQRQPEYDRHPYTAHPDVARLSMQRRIGPMRPGTPILAAASSEAITAFGQV